MSMAACYSRNAAAFTRSSPHPCVELMYQGTPQGTLMEQVPDRRDTPISLQLPGGGSPLSSRLPPDFHPVCIRFSEKSHDEDRPTPSTRGEGWHPPPSQIEVPLRPPQGGLEYHDPPPHLRHMRGYPHPMSGTISPTEIPSRLPPFRVQNGWVPPCWCPEVPPHPIKARYPPGPLQGVGLAQTSSPPTYVR
jgi:hypothetical protein